MGVGEGCQVERRYSKVGGRRGRGSASIPYHLYRVPDPTRRRMVRVPEQTAEKTAVSSPLVSTGSSQESEEKVEAVPESQYMAVHGTHGVLLGTISSHQTEPQARGYKFTEFGVLKQGRRAVGAAAILVTWRPMRSVREPRRWYAGSRSGRHIGIAVQVCTLIGRPFFCTEPLARGCSTVRTATRYIPRVTCKARV